MTLIFLTPFYSQEDEQGGMIMRKYDLFPLSFFNHPAGRLFNWDLLQDANLEAKFSPRSEVVETPESYQFKLDIPGIKKEELDIEVADGYLKISGERKKEVKDELFSEVVYGSFQRTFKLPTEISTDDLLATLDEGVLTIKLPKTERIKPKKITVN